MHRIVSIFRELAENIETETENEDSETRSERHYSGLCGIQSVLIPRLRRESIEHRAEPLERQLRYTLDLRGELCLGQLYSKEARPAGHLTPDHGIPEGRNELINKSLMRVEPAASAPQTPSALRDDNSNGVDLLVGAELIKEELDGAGDVVVRQDVSGVEVAHERCQGQGGGDKLLYRRRGLEFIGQGIVVGALQYLKRHQCSCSSLQ